MSMDDLPYPRSGETAEITVQVDGPVDAAAFKKFKDQMKACIAELAKLAPGGGVGWGKIAIKRKSPPRA